MKLTELKEKVYGIAEVTTTKQLKAQYAEIQGLDMRYKVSWEKALTRLNQSTGQPPEKSANPKAPDFEAWLSNPPDEYKALFAEADTALGSFEQKLDKAKRLTKTARAMATSLDEFAEATAAEAQRLAKEAKQAKDLEKQANLN